MARASWPTGVRSAALVRLLAQMTDAEAAGPEPPLVETLARWLHWTDAVALSAALSSTLSAAAGAVPATRDDAPPPARAAAAARRELERVRTTLAAAMDDVEALHSEHDLAAWRRHHTERQQTMDRAIGALRKRLRTTLARLSPGHARLAAADAALEAALAPRERAVLSAVPGRLDERWRPALAAAAAGDGTALARCTADMRSVLHAELELRVQPVQGLIEALASGEPPPNPT